MRGHPHLERTNDRHETCFIPLSTMANKTAKSAEIVNNEPTAAERLYTLRSILRHKKPTAAQTEWPCRLSRLEIW